MVALSVYKEKKKESLCTDFSASSFSLAFVTFLEKACYLCYYDMEYLLV